MTGRGEGGWREGGRNTDSGKPNDSCEASRRRKRRSSRLISRTVPVSWYRMMDSRSDNYGIGSSCITLYWKTSERGEAAVRVPKDTFISL